MKQTPQNDPWAEEDQLSSEELLASASGNLLPSEERRLWERLRRERPPAPSLHWLFAAAAALWLCVMITRNTFSPAQDAERALLRGEGEVALSLLGRAELGWGTGPLRSRGSATDLCLLAPEGVILDHRPTFAWLASTGSSACRIYVEDEQGVVLFTLDAVQSPCGYPSAAKSLESGRPYRLYVEEEPSGAHVTSIFYVARPEQASAIGAELEAIAAAGYGPALEHFVRAQSFVSRNMWSLVRAELAALSPLLDAPARERLAAYLGQCNPELSQWLRQPHQDWQSE